MNGKIIRFMRFSRNLKQSELSKKIGIADSTLAHYESEYRAVTLQTVNEIAEACDFEILFKDKQTGKLYRFEDVDRMTYDSRVKFVKVSINNSSDKIKK